MYITTPGLEGRGGERSGEAGGGQQRSMGEEGRRGGSRQHKKMTLILSLNTSSKSVVLKLFHVKDPQNYMYLATDPLIEKDSSGDDQKQRFEVFEEYSFEKYIFKDLNKCSLFFKNSRSRI